MRWNNKKDPLDYGFYTAEDKFYIWHDDTGLCVIYIDEHDKVGMQLLDVHLIKNVSHETLTKLYNLIKEGVIINE